MFTVGGDDVTDQAAQPDADEASFGDAADSTDESVEIVDESVEDADESLEDADAVEDEVADIVDAEDVEVVDDADAVDAEPLEDADVDADIVDADIVDDESTDDESVEDADTADDTAVVVTDDADAGAMALTAAGAAGATAVIAGGSGDAADADTTYEWAPTEPKRKKRHLGMWIGIPAGAAAVGLVAASLVLIAPGTAVAGVPVGGLTVGAAAEVLESRLADTTIVLTGAGKDAEVTGADLGATIDARALADSAFGDHPMWNVTQWFSSPIEADVTIDADAVTTALREAAPALFTDPVNATIAFDKDSSTYVATPAELGEGVDVASVKTALEDALASGETRIELDAKLTAVPAATTTEMAQSTTDQLNGMLGTVGFYVGEERTVPVEAAVAASWISLTVDDKGAFQINVDKAAVQTVVDTLPAAINREAVNATVITDSAGKVLREEKVGQTGRALASTEGIADDVVTQLSSGNGVFTLAVEDTAFTTTKLARRIEVDISSQQTFLYENNAVVRSWYISSGLPGHDTDQGSYRIYAQLRTQNMGDPELKFVDYYTPNVPFISYFNGDEALHGAYWHNNFGNQMSHGCVNMPVGAAEYVYYWAPIGTEVWVHA